MPDPISHTLSATPTAVAASGITIGLVGTIFGVDIQSLVWAFIGAVAWRAMQPSSGYTLQEIIKAFAFTVMSMVIGTFGAVIIQAFLVPNEWYDKLAILPAVVAYFATSIINKIKDAIEKLEPPSWLR